MGRRGHLRPLRHLLADPGAGAGSARCAPRLGRAHRGNRVRRTRHEAAGHRAIYRAKALLSGQSYNPCVADTRTMLPVHAAPTCSVAGAAEIVGSKWTVLIVHDLSE